MVHKKIINTYAAIASVFPSELETWDTYNDDIAHQR